MKKDDSKVTKKIAMDFWGRVELAQREAGFDTIKDLCQEAGVAYQTVMNQRSEGSLPSTITILRISRHIKKSIDWLLLGDNISADSTKEDIIQALLKDKEAFDIARYVLSMPKEEKEATAVLLKKISNADNKRKKS